MTTEKNTKSKQEESIFWKNTQCGIEKGIITLDEEKNRTTYHCRRDYSTSFKNPEEKIRAYYFAELVLNYNYPQKRIDIEVIVPKRTPEDRADIVVYEDDECKKPYLIVECKKDGITDAEFAQAIEQAFGNANGFRITKYAIVVAGNTKKAFGVSGFPPQEREKNIVADIPVKYGKTPKYRFIKADKEKDLKEVSRNELITALEKCHDTIWQGGRLAPTTAFDEVSKLLFCKLRDERFTKKKEYYDFQIGTHETPQDVTKRITDIYDEAKKSDSEVFKEDIRLEPQIIFTVVSHLQELAIAKIDLDTKGIAFEKFMEDFFKGKMGQFFTPREIIKFAVAMCDIKPNNLILDPACGSGGFLLNTMDLIRKKAEIDYNEIDAYRIWHDFAERRLFGIEINDQIARVCKMNMIIHDDGHTNIISTDALKDFKDISDINKKFKKNSFDFVITNPPFGAMVKSTERDYLEKYELGKNRKNQKTEILFIERCIEFLKPETGRMAIVLPDGILTNSSLQYVRDFIIENCQMEAVVSLPQHAFTHYGAGVKSSLVFLRRLGKNKKQGKYPVFMAMAEKIGYDATGRQIPQNDFTEILGEYKKFKQNIPTAI